MAKLKQDNRARGNATTPKSIVSESVGNYEKHPFFVKKANQAKNVLQKFGLPTTGKNKTK